VIIEGNVRKTRFIAHMEFQRVPFLGRSPVSVFMRYDRREDASEVARP